MEKATLQIEEGSIVFKAFGGQEFIIETGRTQIIKALGELGTVEFLKKLLDRSMTDALILSNLNPLRRPPEKKAAAGPREEAGDRKELEKRAQPEK